MPLRTRGTSRAPRAVRTYPGRLLKELLGRPMEHSSLWLVVAHDVPHEPRGDVEDLKPHLANPLHHTLSEQLFRLCWF